jgi:uracil permease
MQPLYDNGLYIGLEGAAWKVPLVAFITFATVVILSVKARGFLRIVPFIIAILVGYIFSVIFGVVDLKEAFENVQFFSAPNFSIIGTYSLNFTQVLVFAPVAFVTIAEHIGDHVVLGEITENDFIESPGLHRTLLGDGIATFVSASLGGPANTTYGENTGVIALTKVGSVFVIGLAAIFAILLGFLGYIQAFIMSIPWAVIGGMTIILYGLIAANGVKVLIKDKTDLSKMKNLIIVSTMLVIGLGGAFINITSSTTLQGMSLAAIIGIVLNQVLTALDK